MRRELTDVPKFDRYKLLHGPYLPPKTQRGRRLFCEIRGTVVVGGYHDAPISWPFVKQRGCPLILCGDLVKAIRRESRSAIMHHFGVGREMVRRWRRTLDVPWWPEGSRRLMGRIENIRTDDRLARARINSRKPAALAKSSAKLKGRIIPPHVIEAVRKAAKRPRTEVWKKKMSAYWHRRGHPPGHPELRFWTADEIALLGTEADEEISRRIGRSASAVSNKRLLDKIPWDFVGINGPRLKWLRRESGITQFKLSKKAGLLPNVVKILEGKPPAKIFRERAQRLAAALNCSLSDLLKTAPE
jgi:Cro/C1-type HTH DNA-binding domain